MYGVVPRPSHGGSNDTQATHRVPGRPSHQVRPHPSLTAFTAREVAVSAHLPFREVAKTVVLATRGVYFLAILPSSEMIDLPLLRELLEKPDLRLASESELNTLFPECEVGAMPPFGNLYAMDVIVSPPSPKTRKSRSTRGHTAIWCGCRTPTLNGLLTEGPAVLRRRDRRGKTCSRRG